MKRSIKKKWAAKVPQHQQCVQWLRVGECFCIMGTLAQVYAEENNVEIWVRPVQGSKAYKVRGYHGAGEYGVTLPDYILEWAGIKENVVKISALRRHGFLKNPEIDSRVRKFADGPYLEQVELPVLNDRGVSFELLAQIIEKCEVY